MLHSSKILEKMYLRIKKSKMDVYEKDTYKHPFSIFCESV